jgi:multidrug efflux pump subunit AcrA (membrane-fusion protein)
MALLGASSLLIGSATCGDVPGDGSIEVGQCSVRFADEVDVPALETGRVAEWSVARNDVVEAGAPLARLDDRSMLISRRRLQQMLLSARELAADDFEVRDAELALAEAEAEYETSLSIQNDVRGAVPRSQVRRLKLAVDRHRLQLDQANKRRDRAAADVELREVDVSMIDEQLRNLHVESPIAGIVLDIQRSAGEWIEKGQTIATIGRIDRLHVTALLSSAAIAPAACRGLPVSVIWTDPASGVERSLRGKVLSADAELIQGDQLRLHAEIVNETIASGRTAWWLQPGAEVRMRLHVSAPQTARATAVPRR